MTEWHADFLPGYETHDIPLPGAEPAVGEPTKTALVATLVRRKPSKARCAVLYVHGSFSPTSVLRLPDLGFYARTLHTTLGGEWDYDLELKTTPSPPIRVGWLRAVLLGQHRVAAGLALPMPVLVMCSATTDFGRRWHDGLRTDTVLDELSRWVRAYAAAAPAPSLPLPDDNIASRE